MFRWLTVCLVLCAGTFVLMHLALRQTGASFFQIFARAEKSAAPVIEIKAPGFSYDIVSRTDRRGDARPGLVIHEARIQVIDKQDAASEKDGVILFFGTEAKPGDPKDMPRPGQESKFFEEALAYLVVEEPQPEKVAADQLVVFPDNPQKKYRYRRPAEPLPATQDGVRVYLATRSYRKLVEGDRVQKGDLLALVKPALALADLQIKVDKFAAAEADRRASEKTRDEAKNRWKRLESQNIRLPGSVPQEELAGAALTYERYFQEEISKTKARNVAQSELDAAETAVRMHEIRAQCSGVVTTIYKNRGDAVKSLEPVLHIENTDHLRVEGVADLQDTRDLVKGMPVLIEPTQLESVRLQLSSHTQEVTCVAVSKGPRLLIVSGSEDRSLRIWDSATGQELWSVVHNAAVRSVACTGAAAPNNLILAGMSDGTARLFNLDKLEPSAVVELGQVHASAVTSVAFSPDGRLCLTAGEDRSVVISRLQDQGGTLSPERLHRLPAAHRYAVTSVQFIKATPNLVQFLTVGRDGTAAVWTMENDKEPVRTMEFDQRSDTVAALSTDGERVLLDQAGELRLRSLKDKTRVEGRLRNPPGSANFTTMALFAPDGKTILTNSASEGRLQLWRTPPPNGRGSELRQLVWQKGAVTCGAFAPDNSFVVTGTQDQQVLVWRMPSQDEIGARLTAHISLIERSINDSSRQVRVWAELVEPPPWVVPGGTATMVLAPLPQ